MAKAGAAPTKHGGYFKGVRMDGWENILTGVGVTGRDKRKAFKYSTSTAIDQQTLRNMYRSDGFIRRVIDLRVKEMTRRGFDVKEDPDGHVNAHFQEKGIHKSVRKLLRWARLFGGSVGVIGVDDGRTLDMPVNENGIRSLNFLHVFDRWRVNSALNHLYENPQHPKFGLPQYYEIQPLHGTGFKVHESRVVRMDGLPVDDQTELENQGWGDSVIQACFEQFRSLGSVLSGAEIVVEDFIQAVIGMKGLSTLVESGNSAVVKKRLNLLDQSRHSLNTLILDADGETYTKHASSIAGLPDLIDRFMQACAAVDGTPVSLLFGRSAAGMNATGENDISNFYDSVASDQEEQLQPVHERLIRLLFKAKDFKPFRGKEPEAWEIQYRPLAQPSEKEVAEVGKIRAETSAVYVQNSILDPNEVRKSKDVTDFMGTPMEGDLEEPEPPPAAPGGFPFGGGRG